MSNIETVLIIVDGARRNDANALNEVSDLTARLESRKHRIESRYFENGKLVGMPKSAARTNIFFFPDKVPQGLSALISKLRSHYGRSADMALIGCLPPETPLEITELFDTCLLSPVHPAQICTRVNSLRRLQSMQTEISMRLNTLSQTFGQVPPPANDSEKAPLKVLFVGRPTPEFMTIINALQERNVTITAAFTSFTAFDYLHDTEFDAVVLNALSSEEPALSITETMRRNSRLYHTPTLLLASSEVDASAARAFDKGANDILVTGAPTAEISGRILELAVYHRAHQRLKSEFSAMGDAKCLDPSTGLFNARFFEAHINTHIDAKTPFSLIKMKLSGVISRAISPQETEIVAPQIGTMIGSLVRMQDCAARLSNNSYGLLMPGNSHAEANSAAKRIKAIIAQSGFEGPARNFTVSLQHTVIEPQPNMTAAQLLARMDLALSREPDEHLAQA